MGFFNNIKSKLKAIKTLPYKKNIHFNSNEFSIAEFSLVKADSSSEIIFEGKFNIESHVILRCILGSTIRIGHRVFIGDYSSIRCSDDTEIQIGDDTMIAQGVRIVSTNHFYAKKDILIKKQHINEEKKGVLVGSDCWIGTNCVILPGVTIGKGAVIGAGSIITKDVPEYAIAVGNPARVINFRK